MIHLSGLVPSQAHLHIAVPSVEVISDSVVTLRNCRQRFRFLRVVGSSELSKKQDIIDLSDFLEGTSLGRLSSISIECVIMNINVLLTHV